MHEMGCGDRSVLRPLLGGSSRWVSRNHNNNNNESIELGKKSNNNYERFDDAMGNDSPSGITVIFRKIWLLIWKNFLFRKRHYIVTALEIILPTLFAILLAYAKAKIPSESHTEGGIVVKNITRFQEWNEKDLVVSLAGELSCYKCFIGYSPQTALVNETIEGLKSVLNGTGVAWKGFDTELEIETYAAKLGIPGNEDEKLKVALVFDQGFDKNDFPKGHKLGYKVRFTDWRESTSMLFPIFQIPGPSVGNAREYALQGFSGLQVLVEKYLIKALTGSGVPTEGISVQAFPYPPFDFNVDFNQIFRLLMPLLLCLGFVFMVPSVVRGVVGEKETGIKELLKMMGLPNWMHWLGWMLNSMLVLIVSITIIIILFFYPFNGVGGVVEHSDPTLWWIVLFMYCVSSTAFCFFVSSFFQKPTVATTVGIILWLVSYFGLAQPMDQKYQNLHTTEKVSLCLVPNVALTFAVKIMAGFEGKAVGAHWSNLFEPMNSIDSLSLGIVLLMMLCSTILLVALTLYFENVLPSEYGVRKPWYYVFKPSTWVPLGKVSNSNEDISRPLSNDHRPSFEADPTGIAPGVEIYNLRKVFGSKVAVDDVTLKMFDGQITALLGHNGAGKTTTMSMLTGMFAPTSGRAIVNGHDINTNLEGVRRDLGLCPQHNMLFDKLTVEEHLIFFARLKGLTPGEARLEATVIAKKLQFADKMKTLSMSLSGGQKRKLNLGISLIGGSKVVILDEPTSGMDPEARRAIWDLLLEMRGQRTIVLTTHFMEEADVLGDRIAIMADGKVQCCGSPMFLKRYYGAGYTLRMTIEGEGRPEVILLTVQKYIENASFKSQHSPNSSEVAITLPTETTTTSKFPQMFSELSKSRQTLGIKTIGLSLTTMDEVFIKVGELNSEQEEEDEVDSYSPESGRSLAKSIDGLHANRLTGLRLARQHFYALFVKRVLYTLRKRKLFLSQLLLPVLLLIVAIWASNKVYEPTNPDPPLKMSLSPYKRIVTPYASTDEAMGNFFKEIVGSSATKIENSTLEEELVAVGERDLGLYREQYIVAADMNSSHVKAMYSSIPFHAAPLAINLASNTILRKLTPDQAYSIEVTNHPLKSGMSEILDAAQQDPVFSKTIPILFAVFLPIGLALLAASFIVFPVEERLCKAKQLQLMTGVNPLIFWGSSLAWDFILMLALICVMVACFPIFQANGAFTAYGGGGVLFLILMVFGFTAIIFSYLLSLFPSSVAGGFSLVTVIHVFSGIVLCIVIFSLELANLTSQANSIRPFARIFPTFGAAMCTMQFTEIATKNIRCNLIPEEVKVILCNPASQIGSDFRSCCANCTTLFPGTPCFEPEPYITWSNVKRGDPFSEGSDHEVPGIGQELLYLFIIGIVYLVVLVLIEFGVVKRLLSTIFKTNSSVFRGVVDDEDVKAETGRVQDMVTSGNLFADALIVNDLSKSYGSFAAVSNVSFGVHHGECFGLLGVNGAGKTTTFRMLTGDEIRSSGNAFTSFCNLENSRKKFLSNIGYCPQFDGIVGVLTGKEMLELFCRLRGVDSANIHSEAMRWLGKLGLTASANVQCRKYSGGMKRRLSTAMALIGEPPVVLLDEPTSGVDPMARRQFWKVITSVRDSGQAVILTSHSMEECEALCSRLGIMVNGQVQCLGGVQHLKNKFAQGYSLILKLRSMVPSDVPEVSVLTKEITAKFHPCELKDQHQNVLHYQILNTNLPWDVLFKTMEDLKKNYEHIIEDYAVNETTLEEVFLSFARKQYPNRQADVSFVKKLVTCSF